MFDSSGSGGALIGTQLWRAKRRRIACREFPALVAEARACIDAVSAGDVGAIYEANRAISRAAILTMEWRLDLGDAA